MLNQIIPILRIFSLWTRDSGEQNSSSQMKTVSSSGCVTVTENCLSVTITRLSLFISVFLAFICFPDYVAPIQVPDASSSDLCHIPDSMHIFLVLVLTCQVPPSDWG